MFARDVEIQEQLNMQMGIAQRAAADEQRQFAQYRLQADRHGGELEALIERKQLCDKMQRSPRLRLIRTLKC